ncbi:MAG: HD domain-containing protein [Flavobacteriaceae bacterium]|nr:HD domain-containing protein [Flavobacteriaceae bacterium]
MNFSSELDNNQIFTTIGKAADRLGVDCYVVGGYVRDLIMKRPSKDVDFVCVGSGIALAQEVAQSLGGLRVTIFKNFGTARIDWEGFELEFVGARKESYREDSRKPLVEDGTLEDDQNRRDFTINAMAISLNQSDYGALIDPFNGMEDLEHGIIRTPLDPDITYSDDPLRMMRAIRFATQLDFKIETESLRAIARNAYRMDIITRERIVEELNKILLSKKPSVGFKLLEKTKLLERILPELTALRGVEEEAGQSHKDNFYHTLQVVDNIAEKTDNLWLRWSALLHDIGKAPTKRFEPAIGWTFHAHEYVGSKMVYKLFKRLKMPMNDKLKYVQKIVSLSSRPIALADDVTDSAVRRLVFEAGDDIEDLMIHCESDITTANPQKRKKYLANFRLVREKIAEVEERDRIRNFQPPITGELIMETFDLKPGKEIGVLKDAIKEAILEGEIKNDYNEAYQFMLQKAQRMGLQKK